VLVDAAWFSSADGQAEVLAFVKGTVCGVLWRHFTYHLINAVVDLHSSSSNIEKRKEETGKERRVNTFH